MRKYIFLFLVLVFQGPHLIAQTAPVIEGKNEPMLLKNNGTVDKLEKMTGEVKSKSTMGKSGGSSRNKGDVENDLIFKSVKSPIRVSTDAVFVVKLSDADTDPESAFFLAKASVKKDSREIGFRGEKNKSVGGNNVTLDFETIAPGVYKIIPKALEAGQEYGFVFKNKDSASKGAVTYLFGTR